MRRFRKNMKLRSLGASFQSCAGVSAIRWNMVVHQYRYSEILCNSLALQCHAMCCECDCRYIDMRLSPTNSSSANYRTTPFNTAQRMPADDSQRLYRTCVWRSRGLTSVLCQGDWSRSLAKSASSPPVVLRASPVSPKSQDPVFAGGTDSSALPSGEAAKRHSS